jgi:lactaldehyde dehydrogenase / glycolaldehyde dehydrogenase
MDSSTEVGKQHKLFIGGEWRPASDGSTQPVVNPSTGEVFAEVPMATLDDVGAALDAAKAAQPAWAALSPVERASYLQRVAALLMENVEPIAQILTTEEGKPIVEARGEIVGAATILTYQAEFGRRIQGEILPSDVRDEQILIVRTPHGVVTTILPWNYPASTFAVKIGPALVTGNTLVAKVSSETPLTGLAMAEIIERAGVPAGVVNVLTGPGRLVGEALVRDPRTDMVTMTGSAPVGKSILEIASRRITPVALELGGKAPFIVMADADLEQAARWAVFSRFRNCGQDCSANERTLVQRPIYDEFVERCVTLVKRLRVGDPFLETTDIGPKVCKDELEKVVAMVETARAQGAQVVVGGDRKPPSGAGFERGYWYTPTVITGLRPEMEIMHEEIFGPVMPVMPFDDFDEAIAIANDCQFGLQSYFFTSDLRLAIKAISQINFGEVCINQGFGERINGYHSGYRDSGIGGDNGQHGLELYLRKRAVYLNYSSEMSQELTVYPYELG